MSQFPADKTSPTRPVRPELARQELVRQELVRQDLSKALVDRVGADSQAADAQARPLPLVIVNVGLTSVSMSARHRSCQPDTSIRIRLRSFPHRPYKAVRA